MKTTLLYLAFITLMVAAPVAASPSPSVAYIYSDYGNFRHRDNYDQVVQSLGWKLTKIENTQLPALVDSLGQYDIVLGGALFNYSNVQDFGKYTGQWRQFMEHGGGLVFTDCNYPSHVSWLKAFGEGWSVSTASCKDVSTPTTLADPQFPLFCTPNSIAGLGSVWAHMSAGKAYTVLARDAEGYPTALFRSVGKGFFLALCHWPLSQPELQNLWAFLQCHRQGFDVSLPSLGKCFLGENHVPVSLYNFGAGQRTFSLKLLARSRGKSTSATQAIHVPAGQHETASLVLPLNTRGDYAAQVEVTDVSGKILYKSEASAFSIAPLLDVSILEPAYRHAIYAAAPPRKVVVEARIAPWREKLADLALNVQAVSRGQVVASQELKAPEKASHIVLQFRQPDTTAVRVYARLMAGRRELAHTEVRLPAVPVPNSQVCIDDQRATRVNGQLFFPIGMYHVAMDRLPDVAAIGCNTVQCFPSSPAQARQFLDAAQKCGLKVLLEMSQFLRDKTDIPGMRRVVRAVKNHPALLAWYIVDEPTGATQLHGCQLAHDMIAKEDPNHPVYLVMCSPGEFAGFGAATDILAIDPYPIPHASVRQVTDWIQAAEAAVNNLKPVWLVAQAHDQTAYNGQTEKRGPTPAEERCMVYEGLIQGARGIIYYTWDDGGNVGLIHDATLLGAVKKLNGELASLGPATLKCKRTSLSPSPASPDVQAALFQGLNRAYLVVANTSPEEKKVSFQVGPYASVEPAGAGIGVPVIISNGWLRMDLAPLAGLAEEIHR